MAETVIQLEHINKSYGSKQVLKDICMHVNKGEIYGLIGKNGAGKSTLFKVLLGLTPYQKGTVEIEGETKKLDKARKNVGFLIGNNLFGYMTAKENLRYYSDLKGLNCSKEEIEELLRTVGLDGVKTKVKGYSLGMRQRLGIACAMLGNPEILILDEPTNGLDPQGIHDVRKLVQKLSAEKGMTVIISSHILAELQNTANRFGILNNGVIVKELSEDDLKQGENIVRLSVDDVEKAKEVLKREGIKVLAEERESKSLESFYFSLIGGEE